MKTINTTAEFNDYLAAVKERAEHHAPNVKDVINRLAKEVLRFAPLEDGIFVRTYNGDTKNIAWVQTGEGRFAFTYDHDKDLIHLRKQKLNGTILTSFSNTDSKTEIRQRLSQHL